MKNLRDEIYQEMHGFKVLKRDYVAKGQSKFYYLDPRYDEEDERSQINVSDENIPNPRMGAILAEDIKENPHNYYIWRTCKDDKVRGKHAEREGMVFNWHVPPEGGHPGEDYNCRCWAEPYDEQEYKNKPMIIDISGLEIFKEIKPVDFNTKGFPQYAANDKANMASDATYTSNSAYAHRKVEFRSPEEEKLLKRIGKQIIEREKTIEYAYLDSSGYITTGNGALIDDWNVFKKVHWLYNGRPATEDEMRAEFERMEKVRAKIIAQAKAEAEKSKKPYSNPFQKITAKRYEQDAVLNITKDEADYLMYSHLQRDYNNLKYYLPEIDDAPEAAQDVAFDIQYNPGITDNTWTYFKQYFNERNVPELAKQVHRIGVSKDRNDEMKDKILSIKRW
ncbi:MAG: hypothetical protein II830_01165 [Alphaproteobacteria bacterium]|nr:hypothetical protein [Alphaproteobacteria bacterium]